MPQQPIPNGPAITQTDYKHFDDGAILKTITTKQLFAGIPAKAILKEEQQRNAKDLLKKTTQNKMQKPKTQDSNVNPNKTIIKTLIAKIRKKAPQHTSSIQVMIAALLGYNLALNELDNLNISNKVKQQKRGEKNAR